ncbi:MAG: DUF4124 domain-containing protein [Usitatibacter sp.]
MIRALALVLALVPCVAAAQMYKWVDEKGVTHYSETLPPDTKGTKVDVRPAAGDVAPVPPTDWRQKELDARQQRIQKEQKEEQQRLQEAKQAAARHNTCLRAQRGLNTLQAGRAVYEVNEKGERVYFDDKRREREIAELQADVKKYCD